MKTRGDNSPGDPSDALFLPDKKQEIVLDKIIILLLFGRTKFAANLFA